MPLRQPLVLLAILSASFMPRPSEAARSYDNCTGFVDALPAVIATQGTWCLRGDVSTAVTGGNAITIATNNVTLDCNDFKIGGLAGGISTSASGVVAVDRLNTTVRNCTIRGFYRGVFISGNASSGNVVEDNRFDGNRVVGIYISGDASVARRNLIVDTGGSPLGGFAAGVDARLGADVIDNTIINVSSNTASFAATADGIYTSANPNGRIEGNRIAGVVSSSNGTVSGILATQSSVWIKGNMVVLGTSGGSKVGINCSDATSQVSDNLVRGFTTAINACTNSGGNILP